MKESSMKATTIKIECDSCRKILELDNVVLSINKDPMSDNLYAYTLTSWSKTKYHRTGKYLLCEECHDIFLKQYSSAKDNILNLMSNRGT